MDYNLNNSFEEINQLYRDFQSVNDDVKAKGRIDTQTEKKILAISSQVLEQVEKIHQVLDKDPSQKAKHQDDVFLCQNLQKETTQLLDRFNKKIITLENTGSFPPQFKITSKDIEFEAKESPPSSIELLLDFCKPSFVDSLIKKGYGKIFLGYGEKLRASQARQSLDDLLKKENALNKNLTDCQSKKSDLKTQAHLEKELNSVNNQIKILNDELSQLTNKKTRLQQTINTADSHQKTRIESQELFKSLGGETVTLTASDGVKINGTFLSAQKFKEKLKDDGGKSCCLSFSLPDGQVKTINGIAFEKKDTINNPEHVLRLLVQMKSLGPDGGGWRVVYHQDKVFVIPSEYTNNITPPSQKNRDLLVLDTDGTPIVNPSLKKGMHVDYEDMDLEKESQGGTAIVTTGNAGVYEQHKTEAAAFLFKGMNVFLFNFRGYGQSEGAPSAEGFHRDMFAAYEFVKKQTQQPDSKLLFVPLCMSGGPAAYVAGQRPEVNIFINQSYLDFATLAQDQAEQKITEYLEKNPASYSPEGLKWVAQQLMPVIKQAISLAVPGFEVGANLALNKGQKALFFVDEDQLMPFRYLEMNMKKIAEAGELGHLTVFSAPGAHGAYWPTITSSELKYSKVSENIIKNEENLIEKMHQHSSQHNQDQQLLIDKIQKYQNIADQVKAKGKPLAIEEKGVPLNISDINKEIETLEKQLQQNEQQFQKEMDEFIFQSDKEISQLELLGKEASAKETFVVQNQMDHFLFKAKLSDNIVKTEYQEKRVHDPMMQEIDRINKTLQKWSTEAQNVLSEYQTLLNSDPVILTKIDDNFHVFAIPSPKGEGVEELKFSNQSIQKIGSLLHELKTIEGKEDWVERTQQWDLAQQSIKHEGSLHNLEAKLNKSYSAIIKTVTSNVDSIIQKYEDLNQKMKNLFDEIALKNQNQKEQVTALFEEMEGTLDELQGAVEGIEELRNKALNKEGILSDNNQDHVQLILLNMQSDLAKHLMAYENQFIKIKSDYKTWVWSPTYHSTKKFFSRFLGIK